MVVQSGHYFSVGRSRYGVHTLAYFVRARQVLHRLQHAVDPNGGTQLGRLADDDAILVLDVIAAVDIARYDAAVGRDRVGLAIVSAQRHRRLQLECGPRAVLPHARDGISRLSLTHLAVVVVIEVTDHGAVVIDSQCVRAVAQRAGNKRELARLAVPQEAHLRVIAVATHGIAAIGRDAVHSRTGKDFKKFAVAVNGVDSHGLLGHAHLCRQPCQKAKSLYK